MATILVIDDYLEERQLSCCVLRRSGFLPIEATSSEALIQARSVKPDLILLDLCLPGLEGLEVCKLLKTAPDTCEIPIVVISAISENDISEKVYKLGAAEFILKPYDIYQLTTSVRKHLSSTKEQDHP